LPDDFMSFLPAQECLAVDLARRLTSEDVLDRMIQLFAQRGTPDYTRSDNGTEFTANTAREWLSRLGVKILYAEPGSPWENGYPVWLNGKLWDELLNVETFDTLLEAKVLLARWRRHYNTVRPHSSLAYRPPALEAIQPWAPSTSLELAPQVGASSPTAAPLRGGPRMLRVCRVGSRVRVLSIVLVAVMAGLTSVLAATEVPQTIPADTTWTASGTPTICGSEFCLEHAPYDFTEEDEFGPR
jgi:hypothetical protein